MSTPPFPQPPVPVDAVEVLHDQPVPETILCLHCRRTANNGIKCIGKCVADSDY